MFSAGLRAAGYDVRTGAPESVEPGDVVLSWNRYSTNHDICSRVEKAGGIALIAENGYLAEHGQSPHSMSVRTVYALARHDHNGRGWTPEGDGSRWDALGIDLKPWRADGKHILIAPNRSFGRPDTMMPINWAADVAKRLATLTKREIRIRPHPGNNPPRKPLADDLRDCWAAVIWSSSAGVHSLIQGVPVICCAPYWIAKGATGADLAEVENPPMPERLPALQRLAWGQWGLHELQDGTAFRAVLA